MKLALFDFDGTLTKRDSLFDFLQFYSNGSTFYLKAALCLPTLLFWKLRLLDSSKAKEKVLAIYLKGENESDLRKKGESFIEMLLRNNLFNEVVLEKLKHYKSNNAMCYVISASPDIWIRPFAERMNIKYICTNLQFLNGKYSGRFSGNNCKGKEKVLRLLAEVNPNSFEEIIAYGNSEDDQEMMNLAHKKNWI